MIDTELVDPEFRRIVGSGDYLVQAVCHVFGAGRVPADARSTETRAAHCRGSSMLRRPWMRAASTC